MTMACYLRQHSEEADGKWLSVREAEESQAKIEARHSSRVKAGDPWCLSQKWKCPHDLRLRLDRATAE
jgi:hypothetical protein